MSLPYYRSMEESRKKEYFNSHLEIYKKKLTLISTKTEWNKEKLENLENFISVLLFVSTKIKEKKTGLEYCFCAHFLDELQIEFTDKYKLELNSNINENLIKQLINTLDFANKYINFSYKYPQASFILNCLSKQDNHIITFGTKYAINSILYELKLTLKRNKQSINNCNIEDQKIQLEKLIETLKFIKKFEINDFYAEIHRYTNPGYYEKHQYEPYLISDTLTELQFALQGLELYKYRK